MAAVHNTIQNCWQYTGCGREPGGAHERDVGVCPAALDGDASGFNRGLHGGRICWAVAGSFCGGEVQGDLARKQLSCMTCDFFKQVRTQEGRMYFRMLKPGQKFTRPR